MTLCNRWVPTVALAAALLAGGRLPAADGGARPAREVPSFGTLHPAPADAARAQALAWLKSAGKSDADTLKQFETVWQGERPVLDKVAATLALGSPDAARLLAEARDPDAPAPTSVPNLVKDTKLPAFFRANLALAYGKALCSRKVFEEGLEALKAARPEEVVDPASYLFHKAVAEHALMLKGPADDTVDRLLVDAVDAPERYRMVAALMHFDMLTWKDKDLGWVARKMGVIKDRLDLTRGGKKTQTMQKEVVVRLDEMIKEIENKKCGACQCNGGGCPGGGQRDGDNKMQPGNPLEDSRLGGIQGKGQVDLKKFKEVADVWGKLPDKERAKAMVELTRGMPPKYRDAIEAYFRELQNKSSAK
jgi:tetratricopeptide (TPR) repeat protein